MSDYYKTLGVNRQANNDEIEMAYQKLIEQYHPEKNSSEEAAKIFINVSTAFHTLSNPNRKLEYDAQIIKEKKLKKEKTSIAEIIINGSLYALIYLILTIVFGLIGHHIVGNKFDKFFFIYPYFAIGIQWILFTIASAAILSFIQKKYQFKNFWLETMGIHFTAMILISVVSKIAQIDEQVLLDIFLHVLNLDIKYIILLVIAYFLLFTTTYILFKLVVEALFGRPTFKMKKPFRESEV